MSLFFFINHILNDYIENGKINRKYLTDYCDNIPFIAINVFFMEKLKDLIMLEWGSDQCKRNCLLFSEIVYVSHSLLDETNRTNKINKNKYYYFKRVSYHYFQENNHICLLHDVINSKTICKNIILHLLSYKEFNEMITLKKYLEKDKNLERDVLLVVYVAELYQTELLKYVDISSIDVFSIRNKEK